MNRTTRQYPHELFEELDAVAPRWQQQYGSLQEAALTLGLDQLLLEYLRTEQGQAYLDRMDGVPDTLERNAQERAYREKLLRKLK